MVGKSYICCSCGLKVDLQPDEAPCQMLKGWFVITRFQDKEHIGRYSFCSLNCLRDWAEKEIPPIPDVFLESLDEEEKKK